MWELLDALFCSDNQQSLRQKPPTEAEIPISHPAVNNAMKHHKV